MTEIDATRLREAAGYASRWIGYQQAIRHIPGAVIGVRLNDETIVLDGYGYADVERGIPMSADHIFRIASHSKTFTAVAIMQLVEGGRLRLDDTLGTYIPWICGGIADATIRQALSHTAGITRDGMDSDHWQLDHPFPDLEGLQALVHDGGEVLPVHERFKYSNIAYSLLGLVIEAASGTPYGEFTRTRILEVLELKGTGPETDDDARERLVTGYSPKSPHMGRFAIPDVPTGAMAPATGFYATAGDLLRYASAHTLGNGELLSDSSKREMQASYWDTGNGTHYGLGMAVATIGERRVVGHSGSFPGHSTRTWIDPKEGLAVVVLLNQSNGPTKLLADGVIKLINRALEEPEASAEEAAWLDRFTGQFWTTWGVSDIVRFGRTLFLFDPTADDPTDAPATLAPLDDSTLRIETASGYGSPGETVRYERDDDGQITRVRIGGGSAYPEAIFRSRVAERFHLPDVAKGEPAP